MLVERSHRDERNQSFWRQTRDFGLAWIDNADIADWNARNCKFGSCRFPITFPAQIKLTILAQPLLRDRKAQRRVQRDLPIAAHGIQPC